MDQLTPEARNAFAEQLLVAFFEHGEDGVFIVRTDAIILSVNRAMSELFGYDHDEFIGKPFFYLLAPESRESGEERYRAHIAGTEAFKRYEVEMIRKDGSRILIEVTAYRMAPGGIASDMVVVRDITARKQNEQALLEALQRQTNNLNAIIENAPIGIYVINKNGIVELSNSMTAKLAGAKNKGEIVGMNILESPLCKATGLDVLFKKGLSGESFNQDLEHISHTTHEKMWHHYYGVPLFDVTGTHVDRLLVIVGDLSVRKQFEQELEKNVLERTAELQKKIEELDKFKNITIGRELKMIELKKEVESLRAGQAGSSHAQTDVTQK